MNATCNGSWTLSSLLTMAQREGLLTVLEVENALLRSGHVRDSRGIAHGAAPRNLPDDAPIWYDADDVDHVNREGCNGYVYAGQFATESMTATIGKGRPAIFMQHRFARGVALDVVSVRPERLHNITDDDAVREGCAGTHLPTSPDWSISPRDEFRGLWNRINGDGAWDANPWVWRTEFVRVPHGQ